MNRCGEFGQPDTVYNDQTELDKAMREFPSRFNRVPETVPLISIDTSISDSTPPTDSGQTDLEA